MSVATALRIQMAWGASLVGTAAGAWAMTRFGWSSAIGWFGILIAVSGALWAARQIKGTTAPLPDGSREESAEDAARLTRREAMLDAILQSQPDPVIAVDRHLNLLFANKSAEELFRRGDGEGSDLVGRPAMEVLRDHELVASLRTGVASRQTATATLEVGNEATRIYHLTVTPINVATHDLVGAVCVLHDQTALRRLERIRSDFVANVSHELRTPLTAIHGFIETLQSGSHKDPNRLTRYLDIMHQETTRLAALITDLLHLSRLESPDADLNVEPVDLSELASGVVELYRRPAETKNLHLTMEREAGLPNVRADAGLIRQALLNLVDNALKYTESGGQVNVAIARDNFGVRATVSDTGVGIPPNALDRVFERFYRVDKARSRKEGGTGLGLSIVKHTVESHRGRMGIESVPGEGTSIWFSLPVWERNPSHLVQ